jgi:NADH-quinone oxidoreductase subunit M
MTPLRSFVLALVVAVPATAAAQPAATSPASPSIAVVPRDLDFGDVSRGEARLRVENRGTAPLVLYGVRVIEQGLHLRRTPGDEATAPAAPPPVFEVAGLPTPLAPGAEATVTVRFAAPRDSRQRQFFGALQILSNDASQAADPGSADASPQFVTAVKLQAGGDWLYRHVLLLMTFAPLIGMLVLMVLPRGQDQLYRVFTLAVVAIPFALGLYVWRSFEPGIGLADGNWGLQFVTHATWIPSFNIELFVGLDGISVLMVLLTALISLIAVISSFTITKHVRGYMMMFLLLEAGMMGTFVALDFFLFYVFWEVMLLPMYFLIGIWGGPRKEYAAIKFFLYTLAGSVLMLLALIALYYTSGDPGIVSGAQPLALIDGTPAANSFDLMKLAHLHDFATASPILGVRFTSIVWIALFIGFAIKIPMFPFHTWLPDAHVEAPTAISVILAGVLLKMGTYGIFRMNFAILPEATQWAATAMAVFGVINILYGALCAFAQTDLKKLVAYSSVSHMGFVLLGMAAFTSQGMSGALMQMFNHGTITAMLFLLVGVIYDRAHTREIDAFGGVASKMPVYAAVFGFAFMASLGLPGLSGFIGEALVFLGAFNQFRLLVISAALGVVITAAYHLWAMQRIMLGPFNTRWSDALAHDMDRRELVMLVPLAIIVFVLGFYPMPPLELMSSGIADLRALVLAGG